MARDLVERGTREAEFFGDDDRVAQPHRPGERVTALLEARLRQRDNLQIERSQRFVPLGRSLAESEDESAIIAMLLDDYYQQTLHAPVVQTAETSPPPERTPPESHSEQPRHRRRRR